MENINDVPRGTQQEQEQEPKVRRPRTPVNRPVTEQLLPFSDDTIDQAIIKVRADQAALQALHDHLTDTLTKLQSVRMLDGFTVEYSDRVSFTRGYKLTLKL